MIFLLLKIEILKIRRSLALLMMLACPFMVVLLSTGLFLKSANFAKPHLWQTFWMGNMALWCYFMQPLYIALITALLNGNEHKNHTWRLMLTLPITQRQLYISKAILALAFVVGANMCLLLLTGLDIGLFGLFGYSMQAALDYPFAWTLLKISLACLPVVVIQHAISWRYSNIVLPLAIGVSATMAILQLGSSKYWVYFPWSYTMMAANGSAPQMQMQALGLALLLGLPMLALSCYWMGKRDMAD